MKMICDLTLFNDYEVILDKMYILGSQIIYRRCEAIQSVLSAPKTVYLI